MWKIIATGLAISNAVAAVAVLGLVVREYRRDSDACRLLYTLEIKKRDIVDAARNALAALEDAEVQAQDYALTGETVYKVAYIKDTQTWQDESGALGMVGVNDPATPLAQDLSKAGTRTLNELAAIVSLCEESGRDVALDRIRQSSAIVYLNQARDSLAEIQQVDGGPGDGNQRLTNTVVSSQRRLTAGASALFALTMAGTLLLIVELRRR
jgi:CHASE3 domain sensor protein